MSGHRFVRYEFERLPPERILERARAFHQRMGARAVDRGGVRAALGRGGDGTRRKNYHVRESVGIACGIFIAALHTMGLATLTHTPSPMGFLSEILGRPRNESLSSSSRSGYPSPDALVPDLRRKPLGDVLIERP